MESQRGLGGRGEEWVSPKILWVAHFGPSSLPLLLRCGGGEAGTSSPVFEVGNYTHPWEPRLVGGPLEAIWHWGRTGQRGACLPPILPSSVKMASRAGGRQREWSADVRPCYGHTKMGMSLENVVELMGISRGIGSSAGQVPCLGGGGGLGHSVIVGQGVPWMEDKCVNLILFLLAEQISWIKRQGPTMGQRSELGLGSCSVGSRWYVAVIMGMSVTQTRYPPTD